jgi:hypothetical protein
MRQAITLSLPFTDVTSFQFEANCDESKSKKGNYKIGFAKPPVHSRFKPGQSGNPSGRPKREPSLASALKEELQKPVVIIDHGCRRKRLTKLEATARQLANKGVAGDLGAIRVMADLNRAEAASKPETNKTAALAEGNQDPPVDFVHSNKFPAMKGKPGSDKRDLVDIMDEIYGVGKYAPKPPDRSPSSIRSNGSLTTRDGDNIEADRVQDWAPTEDVSGKR